jgi:two-component system sensor kinase FixL
MLDTILESVPVVMLDRSGSIGFLTAPACTLLGASQAMAIGQPFTMFVENFDPAVASAGRPGDGVEQVWIGRRGDGRKIPLSIQMGLMPEEADGDHATLCLTDLTQSHAADARARELHSQLNRVWRLNSLGEMAASLAHELNQPLSAATTYLHASQLDVRRAGLIGESADRTIELAKAQLLRAGEIIRRMRELLAHETRSLGVERVASMVADMGGVFAMIERAGGVSIEIRVDDLDDRVRAERIQFQQALVNLVRNAVEALAGQPDQRVLISGYPVSDDAYEVRVEDSGMGIPADEMDTIFRPMMTTKSSGMGLGLSVTRTIVESHGGVLKVETSDLGGAAFSFQLIREPDLDDA